MASLSPSPKLQFFDANGAPLSGGKLYTYAAGTTTPLATYTDYGAGTPNANPVILDSRGEASVWLGSLAYKLVLKTSADASVWTVDNMNHGDTATLAVLAASGGSALVGYINGGSGAVATTVQAKLRESVSVLDFGADPTGVNDSTNEIQAAIDAVSAAGGGDVLFPPGDYLIATSTGTTSLLPSAASMSYCVELKPDVRLYGESVDTVQFFGNWTYGTTATNTSQLIMLALLSTPGGAGFYLENIVFRNCMVPIYRPGIISGKFSSISYGGCAFSAIIQEAERFQWDGMGTNGGAGVCIGGWLDPAGSIAVPDAGGWADKCQFRNFNYIRTSTTWGTPENNIDTFFNDNFFINGGAGGGSIAYRGVCSIPLFIVGRYNRASFNTRIMDFFDFGGCRPVIYGGPEYELAIQNINMEQVGYVDYSILQALGRNVVDPWNATTMKNAIDLTANSGASIVIDVFATAIAAQAMVPTDIGNLLGIIAAVDSADPTALTLRPYSKNSLVNTSFPYGINMLPGIATPPRMRISTVAIGSVAYGSFGTDTLYTAATIYAAAIFVPTNFAFTVIGILKGSVTTNNKIIVALYDAAGTLVANSNLAGTNTSATANAFQEVPLTASYTAIGPAKYYIAVQCNGATDYVRLIAGSTFIDVETQKLDGGVFGTLPAITPAGTFTANTGPIAYIY